MHAQIIVRLGTILVSAFLSFIVPGCAVQTPEPENPKAGDIVTPRRASGASSGEGASTPSLYEYSDDSRYITTGKRIRFHAPNAFLTVTNRSNGPKLSISILYDGGTLGPSAINRSNQNISVTLESQASGRALTPKAILEGEAVWALDKLQMSDANWRGRECGLDAYDVVQNDHTTRTIERYGLVPRAAEFRSRWGGSMLFALRKGPESYSDVIRCYQRNPTCTARTTYRNWPVRLTFPNDRVCEYPQVLADARRVLERFYLDETERSPGQTERRWLP